MSDKNLSLAMKRISLRTNSGFSLIEMLVVIGIVGLLLAFAAPNLFSLIGANSLSGEGTLIRNQLTLAQQNAVSKSADVEVRFFKLADKDAGRTDQAFRAFQLFQYNQRGAMVPISNFFRIKAPVTVHEKLSTILDAGGQVSTQDKKFGFDSPREGSCEAPTGLDGTPQDTPYVSFRFRPDGSTDLPYKSTSGADKDTWYLTLVQGEGAVNQGGTPDNYLCLQINPYNGQVSEFRP